MAASLFPDVVRSFGAAYLSDIGTGPITGMK
jgi:hypothetical protein